MRFDSFDSELVSRCRAGNGAAFEELCRRVMPELYGFIYSMLRSHDDTDEALQECLVRVHRHIAKLDDPAKFGWWLMKIAVNQCRSMRGRAGAHQPVHLDEALEYPNERVVGTARAGASPRESASLGETRRILDAAIRALPERQRAAVILFEVEDRPIREVAELLECSEGAVKFNLHEARKKLRAALTAAEADPDKNGGAQ